MPDPTVLPLTVFCPATMCPLVAADGSPWTHEVNAPCPGKGSDAGGCSWWSTSCDACQMANAQVAEASDGRPVVVAGPNRPKRQEARKPRDYECARAKECRWQIEAESVGRICPPRTALRLGLDPRVVLF